MTRDLLNNVSDWVLASLFIATSIAVALGGWALVRRFLPG
jgi:mannose/fructose/N-acetylgalactosamine-specific phosphotransferase system component IIC